MREVRYLQHYDARSIWLADRFDMPERMLALLIRFLEQNHDQLYAGAREKEFDDADRGVSGGSRGAVLGEF